MNEIERLKEVLSRIKDEDLKATIQQKISNLENRKPIKK